MTSKIRWAEPDSILAEIGSTYRSLDIVSDSCVLEHPIVSQFVSEIPKSITTRLLKDLDGEIPSLKKIADTLTGDAILAIGGGSVMDRAKCLHYLRSHRSSNRLHHRQRCALRDLADEATETTQALLALPTTLGTGSEISSGVVLNTNESQLLARGLTLIPDQAWHLKDIFLTLPRDLLSGGIQEILFRVLAPWLERRNVDQKNEPIEEAQRLISIGNAIALNQECDDDLLAAIQIGALSHQTEMHAGSNPFGSRIWYVANDTAALTGLRKMDALGPLWLAAICLSERGDLDWCSFEHMARIASVITSNHSGGLYEALTSLFDKWGRPTKLPIGEAQHDRITRSCLWRWGQGLPMLRHATASELTLLTKTAATPLHDTQERREAPMNETQKLVDLELDAQELEDMEAPSWDSLISAAISLGIGASIAIT